MSKPVETPLMKQYAEMKKKHPDAILLFRVGDFYETFSEDAIAASEILGITLTRRANGKAAYVELAGFPHHALDTYLPKLVRAGKRVAICEQLEDPKLAKTLVKRGITELVTPGVNINDNSLKPRENNFLAGIHHPGKGLLGVAFLDLSTGEFLCAEGTPDYVDKLLNNIAPKELLRMHGLRDFCTQNFTYRCASFELDDWVYTSDAAEQRLLRQFSTASLKGFGVDHMKSAVIAAGSLLHYLDLTKHENTRHITTLARIDGDRYVRLDRFTLRNLELIDSSSEEGMSLLNVIDRTLTPMGARLLHRWLPFPLIDVNEIRHRHDAVEFFFRYPELRDNIAEMLRHTGDIERLGGKLSTRRISPRDFLTLKDSLFAAARIRKWLDETLADPDCFARDVIRRLADKIEDTVPLVNRIHEVINPQAPALLSKGNVVREGVSSELDEVRRLTTDSRGALEEIQRREIESTGISSLRIGFNNVFGYYLEVRNTHRDKVPPHWIRKQTLVSAERYITPELKQLEEKIKGAEEKIELLEGFIYNDLIDFSLTFLREIQQNSAAIAEIDCLLGFAKVAEDYNYVRPEVNDSNIISISDGRHPVIERRLPAGQAYISNSLTLDSDKCQIMMITGPNMAGKSALLRQTALITIMAQIGCFVPASAAKIGYVDKIFSRVGASDNISSGESTFMVEMNEAASILNNMSPRSLILFDELGRGTSTYDGISIAWAIVEYLHENGHSRPKTLFATHYHELNEMENSFSRIENYNVSVKEINGKVVFMRKLVKGGSEHSFGIHVARLAGLPPSIVRRADQVLERLEADTRKGQKGEASPGAKTTLEDLGTHRDGYQLSFFQLDDPLLSQIRDALLGINIDNLTPLQALTKLHDLQGLLTGR